MKKRSITLIDCARGPLPKSIPLLNTLKLSKCIRECKTLRQSEL